MDMHLLLMSLEAIERVCMPEKSNAQSGKKASNKGKEGTHKQPGTESMIRVPKKAHTKKHCKFYKKHGGTHNTHDTRDCRNYEKGRMEKANFHTTSHQERKNDTQSCKGKFAQLSKIGQA
jgi:hypothetical protein